MGEVGARNISRRQQYRSWLVRLWVSSRPITFHGISDTVVGWHGYGALGARNISRSNQYCGWLSRLWAMSGPVTFHRASNAIYSCSGTVVGEWTARDISRCQQYSGVVGYARYISRSQQYCGFVARLWARSGPVTFRGASNIVVDFHGCGRGRCS